MMKAYNVNKYMKKKKDHRSGQTLNQQGWKMKDELQS